MKPEHKSKQERDDYDSPWKDMIENYLKDFLYFFFPKVAENIDWEKGYKFLDNELRKVVRDAKLGKRLADKLIEVYLKDGSETWILIHIEVQGQKEIDFAERMFIYNTRIFNLHKRPVVSLAVLSDEHSKWKPKQYSYSLLG
ncbi:MAG: transposase, partial [Desulfobacterales bacterium]|nr:transposase [Desulfobacterales bacterium]